MKKNEVEFLGLKNIVFEIRKIIIGQNLIGDWIFIRRDQ